jgi:hypothetical protein
LLVAYNETVDRYLMHHPDFLFRPPGRGACVDPQNPYILARRL